MKIATITTCLALAACGYSAKGNELIGQVKKVIARTPVLCGDYVEADISLGVVRNGVGSLSKEDVVLLVERDSDATMLRRAAERGALVKVRYDERRVTLCVPDHWLTGVSLVVTAPVDTAPEEL